MFMIDLGQDWINMNHQESPEFKMESQLFNQLWWVSIPEWMEQHTHTYEDIMTTSS